MNDIDRQFLKLNARIIREVGFERDGTSALQAVVRFEETFFRAYGESDAGREIFCQLKMLLNGLIALKPIAKKTRRSTPQDKETNCE